MDASKTQARPSPAAVAMFGEMVPLLDERYTPCETPEYLRMRAMLEPEQVAELSGVSRGTVLRIEHGEVENLRAKTLVAIAKTLDVPYATYLYAAIRMRDRRKEQKREQAQSAAAGR